MENKCLVINNFLKTRTLKVSLRESKEDRLKQMSLSKRFV